MEIDKEKKQYRTKNRAENTDIVPDNLPVITNKNYLEAMTMRENDTAYIYPIKTERLQIFRDSSEMMGEDSRKKKIVFAGTEIWIENMPASYARIKDYYAPDRIPDINPVLLKLCYGIILKQYEESINAGEEIKEIVTVYYPDIAKKMGKGVNIGSTDVFDFINNLLKYQTVVGITKYHDIVPLLVFMGYDANTNTIKFASPYITKIIKEIYQESIRRGKRGEALLQRSGLPLTEPAYSFLVKSSIATQRNTRAVEVVCIIVATIERAGNTLPHIGVKTIIERNIPLKKSLKEYKRNSDRNKLLYRVFKKAFELLEIHTRLKDKYKDIVLPDPYDGNNIPTMATLSMVYEFPHNGEIMEETS